MSGYLFIVIGYLFAHYRAHVVIRKPLALLFIVIGILWSINFGFASMQNMRNPLLYICNAAIINLSLLSICYYTRLTSKKIRSALFLFGKNTIIVLCTNNLVIEIIRLADYRFTGNFMMSNGTIGDMLFFMLLSFAEIPLILFFMNRFPRKVSNVNIPIKQ